MYGVLPPLFHNSSGLLIKCKVMLSLQTCLHFVASIPSRLSDRLLVLT
jgi:hypothetical protein